MDAGSAGATTFDGFRKFAAEPAQTRLLCILNASMHGLASAGSTGGGGGGELDSLNQVQVAPLVRVLLTFGSFLLACAHHLPLISIRSKSSRRIAT